MWSVELAQHFLFVNYTRQKTCCRVKLLNFRIQLKKELISTNNVEAGTVVCQVRLTIMNEAESLAKNTDLKSKLLTLDLYLIFIAEELNLILNFGEKDVLYYQNGFYWTGVFAV